MNSPVIPAKAGIQRRWFFLAATLLIAGCATTTSDRGHFDPQTGPWSGRLALRVESDPPQSYSVAFELSGDAASGELTLASPLGNTLAVLRWQPADAVLLQKGRQQHYESADRMIEETTGAAIPMQALFAWLHGQPANVQGWQVDLSRWTEGRLLARRQTPQPETELRLVIDR
ncbi:MAG: outer membrane lipoprotein LolB [Burkholderiaceae bacterium]|jgi:outer membrane lipoprotein LolB|nr:outer membrane lipoprotein LolB [Burkholderiaceae bacterium]